MSFSAPQTNSASAGPGPERSDGARQDAPTDLVALLQSRAGDDEKPAYIFLADGENESARINFAELDRRARAIAVRLLAAAAPGERALLLYPPGLDFIAAFFACLYAGIVAVPAYPPSRRRLERARPIVCDCAPALVLTTEGLREEFSPQAVQAWDREDLVWLATDTFDLAAAAHWTARQVAPEDPAFLQYTSGSTGHPKGVIVSHGNLIANEAAIAQAFGHDADSVVVGWLPLYHDMGLIGNVLQPLVVGSTAILMPPLAFIEKPLRWLKAVSTYRAQTSGGPNFGYELCVRQISPADRRSLDLASWRVAFNGSEPVRASTLDRFTAAFADCGFRREAFYPCYGMAEATLFVSGPERGRAPVALAFDKEALSRGEAVEAQASDGSSVLVDCGASAQGHRIRIVDPDTLRPCPDHRIGEIWLAGPSVARGYFGQPDLSEKIFKARTADDEGPYLRTGDLGFLARQGLFIAGRIKDLIIIRGANYYASDFERLLDEEVPGLRPGCAAAFSVVIGEEEALVLVAEAQRHHFRAHGGEPIFAAIRAAVAREFAIAVGDIVLAPPGALAKTTSGKVRRQACRAAYLANTLRVLARSGAESGEPGLRAAPDSSLLPRQAPRSPSASEIERFLRQEAARLLRCPEAQIPAEKSLAEIGLDSIRIVELKHAAEAALEIELPMAALLNEEPLRALAAELAALTPAMAEKSSAAPSQERDFPASPQGSGQDLSQTQQALWTAHHLDPDSISYNLHLALDVAGELDEGRLTTALTQLMERHEQLRAVYRIEDGQARQFAGVADPGAALERVDAAALDADALQEDMTRRARRPFDLERGPLLRLTAYRLAPRRAILLFRAHHIAVDLWSLTLLVKELNDLYLGLSLPPPGPGYADFTRRQQQYLASPSAASDFDYWRGRLGRPLPALALPLDFPRPSAPGYRGGSHNVRLGPDLAAALRALAQNQGVSLFALLLAAYQTLLQRYCGQEEIIVGVPTSGRLEGGFADLVGNCVNPVAIAGRPLEAEPFTTFLRRLGADVREALVHQSFPFPVLVERLRPDRQGDNWPIYQTTFAFQQARADLPPELALLGLGESGAAMSWCACGASQLSLRERVENFDLKLMAAEARGELVFSFQHRADIFSSATISRLASHFSRLLEGIVAAPETRIGALPLLSAAELAQLIVAPNATAADYPAEACLHELFAAQATRTPDAVALNSGSRRLTYGELDALANQLSHRLRDLGIGPDRVVALFLERSLALVVAILGVWKTGAAYLPLDPSSPPGRLDYMTADAAPALIIATAELSASLPPTPAQFRLDEDFAVLRGAPKTALPAAATPLNLAYVIYTSGSTGRPKGVAVPHRGVVNRLAWMQARYPLGAADAVLQKTPYGFDVSVWELIWPLLTGARLVLARPGDHGDPAYLAEIITREGVTIAHFVPAMLQAFLATPDIPPLPSLRHVICSGEALSCRLRDQFHAGQPAKLHNLYGPTEASIDVAAHACSRADNESAETGVPIGRPIWNTQIYLLDAALQPAPAGVAGELYIGGAGLARGYLRRPGLTAERFIPDPFGPPGGRLYRTGDLARWRPDGELDYLGRLDHQVKIRGHRIEPGEIEAALLAIPGVRQAVAAAREDDTDDGPGRRILVAYVAGDGGKLEPARLRAELARTLPDYMIPSLFVRVERFALTPSGKIDRKALPAPGEARRLQAQQPDDVPQTPTEDILVKIWKDVLGLEAIGANDNFFELGGHSLLATKVMSRVRQAFDLDLPLRRLFESPTPAALALAVEAALIELLDAMSDEEAEVLLAGDSGAERS